ncbi:MAG: single-stranded DNA-binding protein, partial [Pseudomonadota bacterium]
GSQVYVEGSIRTRKWQDKEGAERYTTEIVANEMQMLGGRGTGEGGGGSAPREGGMRGGRNEMGGGARRDEPARDFQPSGEGFDDDIPF